VAAACRHTAGETGGRHPKDLPGLGVNSIGGRFSH
jgi:hypothetical protein